jgi:RNA polymerase sigma factor (sigma-70 family)
MNNPAGWLFKCVERKSLNWLRDERRRRITRMENGFDLAGPDNPEKTLEAAELSRFLRLAIEKLPDQQKKIIQLKMEYGMNRKEIARQCKISESTVKNQINSAYKNLKNIMEEIFRDYFN